MKIVKLKPLMAVLLACYIDLAICGFQSLGAASETVNQMPNWTILRSHTIGPAMDGSYFAEVRPPRHRTGRLMLCALGVTGGDL